MSAVSGLSAIAVEWRTVPTDLAGWAMRAEQMRQRAEKAERELEMLQRRVGMARAVLEGRKKK